MEGILNVYESSPISKIKNILKIYKNGIYKNNIN